MTIALRSFDQGGGFAYTEPSYSLYPVLADIQGARKMPVALDKNFMLPENAAELAAGATLFIMARLTPRQQLPQRTRQQTLP